MASDPTLEAILAHARKRWCWDDEAMLAELYERLYDAATDTPEAFVDDLAEDYDLTDPRSLQFTPYRGA
ncbi:MAG: hypothetical protein ACXWVD_00085 [Telluria sp.]